MIGSHDSYTFLPASRKIFNLFSFLWRTQTKSIAQQIEAGVEYFDVRVRRYHNVWRVCHGLVDFNLVFTTLSSIVHLFSSHKLRLILERGDEEDEMLFLNEIMQNTYKETLQFACIKKGWKILLDRHSDILDYTYTPWLSGKSFWYNIKRFNFFSTIKKWAKKYNPKITEDMKQEVAIYFMDYI